MYYNNGGLYDGEWKNDQKHGYGVLYGASDEIIYEGYWKDEKFDGKGKLFNEEPESDNGFTYMDFDQMYDCWKKYEGEFSNNLKNGEGILYLLNGDKFEGMFNNDQINGKGVFTKSNGEVIHGEWKQNKLQYNYCSKENI